MPLPTRDSAYLQQSADESSGSAGLTTFPTGAAAANGVSIAEVLRYAQENIILGAGTALPSGTSLYGVLAGATGIPTFPSAAIPANDVSLAEVIRQIYAALEGTAAGHNGVATWPAAAAYGNNVSIAEVLAFNQDAILAGPRCCEKSDGAVLNSLDPLFTITGGPIKVLEITGIVTTAIGAGTTNAKLQITTTEPAATVDMNAAAVDIDADAAGTSYQTINTTGILTPVTAGFVKEANSFATLPTTFLCPIGSIGFTCDAARSGNIKWYLRYVPLSPSSRVAAAA